MATVLLLLNLLLLRVLASASYFTYFPRSTVIKRFPANSTVIKCSRPTIRDSHHKTQQENRSKAAPFEDRRVRPSDRPTKTRTGEKGGERRDPCTMPPRKTKKHKTGALLNDANKSWLLPSLNKGHKGPAGAAVREGHLPSWPRTKWRGKVLLPIPRPQDQRWYAHGHSNFW